MIRTMGLALALAMIAAGSASAQDKCEALNGLKIPSAAVGLKTTGATVARAVSVRAQTATGQGGYCQVNGAIHPVDPKAPEINFQVNLPDSWNGKALHFGGGGYDGTVVAGLGLPMAPPGVQPAIFQGYVTFGSDSGHQTSPGQEPAAFAANDEALRNFGGDQLKKTHDVALALVKRLYGKAPKRTYFYGGSQGGHEGFLVVQRWPKDYDGVIALYPVYDIVPLQTNGVQLGQVLFRSAGSWINPAKANVVTARVVAACDELDGVRDGLISNTRACHAKFDPRSLLCANGADAGDSCLSYEQLATLEAFASERRIGVEASGIDTFPRWPVFEGANMAGRFGLGETAKPASPPAANNGFTYFMGDQGVRYLILRDPASDSRMFVPGDHAQALKTASKLIDASNPDISAFRASGGKLILLHGTIDMAVSPYNTINYYERMQKRFGGGLTDFVRFYVVPGYGHGTGPFTVGWDVVATLDAWVDRQQPPGQQVAVDLNAATAGRARPLCEYPKWPKYKGSGDPNRADSFECVI